MERPTTTVADPAGHPLHGGLPALTTAIYPRRRTRRAIVAKDYTWRFSTRAY